MFYQGDLQSGISKAVQENKLVVCFVTDSDDESSLWENQFLQEDPLKSSLTAKTVLLRLQAGSQEASYLAAIFPLPKTPVIVIIKNGELKEYIAPGVSKEDFGRRMDVVLGAHNSPLAAITETPTAQATIPPPRDSAGSTLPTEQTPTQTLPMANDRQQSRASRDAQVLAERSARLKAQKKEQDAQEKAKRARESKARREAAEQAAAPGTKPAENAKYALMQKKRQQEAREERARILKRVEDDKAARRENEAARKEEARARAEGVSPPSGMSSINPPLANASAECAIQIRLFDGSTIRSRFPSQGTLRKDVRPWIDENKEDDNVPYTLKHVSMPGINKTIEASDEERSLQSLGLTPSATLIIIPVTNATNAYEGNSSIVSRGISAGYGLVSSGLGLASGVLGSLLGTGVALPANERPDLSSVAPENSTNLNIRTFRDHNAGRDDQQFYNGNALNFEPRHDEEDDKED